MIDEILPPAVAVEEAFFDPGSVVLFPAEQAVVAGAVAKRRDEFATVRQCARVALCRLGVAPAPILPGAGGAPRFPPGIVGSMTHCAGYRAAALAYERDVLAIGIDAEPNEPLPHGVLDAIAVEPERRMLARLEVHAPGVSWDRLVFSAKEAVYKVWFPLTGQWLDFTQAEMVIDPGAGRFAARLLVPGPMVAGQRLQSLNGRYVVRDGLVLTAITVAAWNAPALGLGGTSAPGSA